MAEKQRDTAPIKAPLGEPEPLAEDQFLRVRIFAEGEGNQLEGWQFMHNIHPEAGGPISVYQLARDAIDKFAADVRDHADVVGMPRGLVLVIEPLVAPD